jgi:hypothetical protein
VKTGPASAGTVAANNVLPQFTVVNIPAANSGSAPPPPPMLTAIQPANVPLFLSLSLLLSLSLSLSLTSSTLLDVYDASYRLCRRKRIGTVGGSCFNQWQSTTIIGSSSICCFTCVTTRRCLQMQRLERGAEKPSRCCLMTDMVHTHTYT